MYYKRPRRKRFIHFLLPFMVIAFIFSGVIFAWGKVNSLFVDQNRNTINEKVFLNIESGSAKAMTVGKSEWQNAPDKIYLYRGENLKTGADGRATLTYFDQSLARLNTSTEVTFTSLKKKQATHKIETKLIKGDLWAEVEKMINPDSTFGFTTDLITVDSRGGIFAITAPGTVYMIEGSAQVGVKVDDEVIKTFNVGVGQQFIVDQEGAIALEKGEDSEVIFALDEKFKRTNWYRWNMRKDGDIKAFEESDELEEESDLVEEESESFIEEEESTDLANVGRVAYVTKPSDKTETNQSTIRIEGSYDPEQIETVYVNSKEATAAEGKWSLKVNLEEGQNVFELEAEDLDGAKVSFDTLTIVYDQTAPETPLIETPELVEGEDFVEIESVEQVIEGTVSKDTQAVIVNDYRLSKYVPGSQTFTYYAKTAYGNLEVGENEYKVIAEDKAGNQSEAAIILLNLSEDVVEESAEEEPTESEVELPTSTSSGGVKITAPNSGESFETKETEFEIEGEVPENTAKVTVNDYQLSLFEEGDTSFKYRAYKSIGNLEIGKKNTYSVKAYDSEGDLLGTASITIDVESGSQAAPVITVPTTEDSYSTTLDTLVISGTVGKWVTRMYVDNVELKEYIPGSEEWRTTVELSPGENSINVTAEKQGDTVGSDSITITYQP